jgi:peptidoglycan hydrolase-like protein with peptidoglycan-binding domain
MKKLLLLLALSAALPLYADDRIRDVQTELKTQGFYYGEINGAYSTETTAALRRYQIRNGLEVTGTLTDETIKSLGIGSTAPQQTQPAPPPPTTQPRSKPSLQESDRSFLSREETPARPAPRQVVPAPRPPIEEPDDAPAPRRFEPAASDLPEFFADTPYASAPREVQESTLRRAQSLLASRGIYRDVVDGEPGPATEEALLAFQRSARLPLSGRLDLETLSALRLLPIRSTVPLKGFLAPRRSSEPPVYRGIWVR